MKCIVKKRRIAWQWPLIGWIERVERHCQNCLIDAFSYHSITRPLCPPFMRIAWKCISRTWRTYSKCAYKSSVCVRHIASKSFHGMACHLMLLSNTQTHTNPLCLPLCTRSFSSIVYGSHLCGLINHVHGLV